MPPPPSSPRIIVPPSSISESSTLPVLAAEQRAAEQSAQGGSDLELQDFSHPPHNKSTQSYPPVARHGRIESEGQGVEHFPLLEANDTSELGDRLSVDEPSMSRRGARPKADSSGDDAQNGDLGPMEHRRKYSLVDGSTASQVTHLVNRQSFDDQPLPSSTQDEDSPSAHGFWDLPRQDRRNFLLLVMLYFLQGIPMGLAAGSIPIVLKAEPYELSYAQIGVYSLASYPYSMKLLWSPIVDSLWSPNIGRRKSWILPVQMFSGFVMIWLGGQAESMMKAAGEPGTAGIWAFTWWWFFLVFTCATQDIAVDGWALTLLSQKHISYASTAQTVGLTAGSFLSHTVFLAFNSPSFANKYFRTEPLDVGLWTVKGYLTVWGWIYVAVTVGLAVFKREEKTKEHEGIMDVYKVMFGILKLRNVQIIIIIHLIAKIGFQANDAVTNLKLLDKGFSQEDLALTVLIDFPFEIALGYYVGKWCSAIPPMQLWCWGFIGRLTAAALAQFVVMIFPSGGVTTWYLLLVIVEYVYSMSMGTIMFVAVAAFHAKISDPVIGGTYMTLLATVSNLGGTFPRFFILRFVELFTAATCQPSAATPEKGTLKDGALPVTSAFSCVGEKDKHRCIDGGGTCVVSTDGYYIMNVICIVVGVVTFWSFIRPKAMMLQSLPLKAWRLAAAR